MPAIDRLAHAVVAADLAALDTRPAHAARLARRLAGRPRPALALADLDTVPRWLRGTAEARQALARKAALALAAPDLARSIDGKRLQAIAALVGADTLDWAIGLGGAGPGAGRPAPLPDPADLEATGIALLAMTLPPALAARLDAGAVPAAPAAASAAVAAALAAPSPAAAA